ncbi:MAG: LacI family transcriptional regulator [Fimbriimonadales bacterium]|nr:LacI family transcriptional regulator [Fimbriimonadales bacterium]
MPVTLRDVARQAGVSPAAASKVLHGAGGNVRVSPEKAATIREVARELNYRPNRLARSLRKASTQTVGLVFERFGSIAEGPLYYPYLLDGVASVLFENHYRLAILPEVDSEDAWGTLADGRLDGVIWCKYDSGRGRMPAEARPPIPVVALNAGSPLKVRGLVSIFCDNECGTRLALEHLAALGHRRVAFLMESGEEDTPDAVARRDAFLLWARSSGIEASDADVLTWDREARQLGEWWRTAPPHTAVLAWNERMAAMVLRRAAEEGLRVPTDLSVVGYDSTAYCDALTPRLTAVRQPIREMARAAAQAVLGMIRGEDPPQAQTIWPCTLDVRESTTSPARR